MLIIVLLADASDLKRPCDYCGAVMRLVGIEPDIKTGADLFTYECIECSSVQATIPSVIIH